MRVTLWKAGFRVGASSLALAISTAAIAADGAPADTAAAQSPLITAQSPTGSSPAQAVIAADAPLGTEEIIVRGVRGSLLRSIQTKRDAATIVDAISAEELGKFPNRNVAEALGNIPGVTVGRDGRGEGRQVTIRGLGEDFAITTLNGRILPTDSTDRSFAFDVLPSEMISGAEVTKAVQASSLEGSIGGNIDLRSARPFDHRGFQASGSLEGQYNDLPGKVGFRAAGVVSDTFADDTMGLLFSATYSQYKLRTDNLGEYSPASDTEEGQQFDFNGNGVIDNDGKQYVWPLFYSNGVVLGKRKRLGISGSYQWKPSEKLTFTLDGLYSRYSDIEHNYRQSNFLSPRNDLDSPIKWVPGSVKIDANGVVTNFALNDLVAEVLTTNEPRTVNTYQIGGHVDWQPTERLKFVVDGYTGQATRNSGGKQAFVVAGIPDSSGVFATRDGHLPDLSITIPGGRTIDQATNDDFHAHYVGINGDNLKDRTQGTKIDGTWETDLGPLKSLSFGGSWTNRRKVDTVIDNLQTECNFCGYPFSFGQIGADVVRPFPVSGLLSKQPGNFPRNFPIFDIDSYLAALPRAENNPDVIDPVTGEPYPSGYATQVIQPDLPLSFRISERTWAGYVQANLSGDHWRGDLGVRIVNTTVSSEGWSTTISSIVKRPGNQADYDVQFNESVPVKGGGSYTKALPAVNFAYDFTDNLRLRLAASKAIARPTFGQLSPASDASNAQSGTFIIYDSGNPNLKPTKADQLDASLEFYKGSRFALSAAVFYKHIKDFVTTLPEDVTITPTNQPADQQQSFDFTRVEVRNGDKADVVGLEVGGQYFLDNGLGFQANLTYNHSRATSGGIKTALPGAIPFSANAKIFYESHGIHAQLSYNYASRYTQAQAGLIDYLPIKEDAYHEMSATLGYDLNSHIQAYVSGSNLLGSAIQRFNTYRNVPAFYEYSGRSFFFGVRARM
ncbi:TonB-dependent receptor [Sphingomonas oligoaromativorans]|uniref:TonB-dependent receptor n=1 Tax=Sphingomonas oligoaromativorans TaxID=575322 RepID=UPI00141EE503|nr:TonB-dependent receptor [Sphingomonas oligoaromativorans]NIJ33337.1 TonB-dependent receptor [Sphingomonas oligoaromativorans]